MTRTARIALTLACLLGALPASAGSPVNLLLTGRYQVRLGDAVVKEAKIYRAEGLPRMVVLAPGLDRPLLVTPGQKSANWLGAEAVLPDPDDSEGVVVDVEQISGDPLPATVVGPQLRVVAAKQTIVLEPKEPVLGLQTRDALLAALPEWRRNASAYKPMIGDIRLLDTLATPTEVEIFFGSWCPHCEKAVPKVLRLMQDLKTPKLVFLFHGVPTQIDNDPEARQNNVNALPTALIRQGGKVIARFDEVGWDRPEGMLAATLFGGAPEAGGTR